MEWILDPSIWAALSTLIVLEVVLGIDNVVFITILSEKLPPEKRDRARILGLSLALVMRIILLCLAGWLMTLKTTLFTAYGINFNAKDIIMLAGGLFLIFKATMELNERLEGKDVEETKQKKTSNFWVVIAQIVVLDAVFSLDSVITAAGMAKDNVPIMVIAVSIAMIMMMFASKPLANFVNNHPTIVILCLSFLLMIGFSLIAEGFGVNIPKGYLYAAIGFSILIEFFNQMASFNRRKFLRKKPLRQRTAEAILGLLKGEVEAEEESVNVQDQVAESSKNETFKTQELVMVERVLSLAQRSVSSVMTSRQDVKMININDPREEILKELSENQHTRILITDDVSLDEPIGIIQVNDLMKVLLEEQEIRDYVSLIKQPLIFPETISLLVALEQFKNGKTHFAIVVDEFGSMQGIITVTDVMETIAGEFPTEDEDVDVRHDIQKISDNSWLVNGYMPIDELLHYIDLPLEDKRDYHTLAGLLMEQMQHIPAIGEHLLLDHFKFEVIEVDSHRIVKVMVTDLNENLN